MRDAPVRWSTIVPLAPWMLAKEIGRWELLRSERAPKDTGNMKDHDGMWFTKAREIHNLTKMGRCDANELGVCEHGGVLWDLVTRAGLWSANSSAGPWKRVVTLRNGSHMETVCRPSSASCSKPCSDSCCSGTQTNPSFVTWAPTLLYAPSSANTSKDKV